MYKPFCNVFCIMGLLECTQHKMVKGKINESNFPKIKRIFLENIHVHTMDTGCHVSCMKVCERNRLCNDL